MTLKLAFRDPYIPPTLLDELATNAKKQLPQIFGGQTELQAAFDQHTRMPQPNDRFSTGIGEVLHRAQKVVTERCGPSAARWLVPIITNEND